MKEEKGLIEAQGTHLAWVTLLARIEGRRNAFASAKEAYQTRAEARWSLKRKKLARDQARILAAGQMADDSLQVPPTTSTRPDIEVEPDLTGLTLETDG